jgi:hypothetical protein
MRQPRGPTGVISTLNRVPGTVASGRPITLDFVDDGAKLDAVYAGDQADLGRARDARDCKDERRRCDRNDHAANGPSAKRMNQRHGRTRSSLRDSNHQTNRLRPVSSVAISSTGDG